MPKRPHWIRVRAPSAEEAKGMRQVRDVLRQYRLNTVCQGAVCPNAVECWGDRTATFMILGDMCTRACRFCAVSTGNPGGVVDHDEPFRLAAAVRDLSLKYVVLTSVDRDDLPDGGASVFAQSATRIREVNPHTRIEVLVPDFSGDPRALNSVLVPDIQVVGHNLETVRRLTPALRDPRAGFDQSLNVLSYLSANRANRRVKSGLMLGLGETRTELREAFSSLRDAGVDILTLGQYLRPTANAVPIVRYIPPDEFDELATEARQLGFSAVVSGPMVRSSFHAAAAYEQACG